jgi:hypothetical protein
VAEKGPVRETFRKEEGTGDRKVGEEDERM